MSKKTQANKKKRAEKVKKQKAHEQLMKQHKQRGMKLQFDKYISDMLSKKIEADNLLDETETINEPETENVTDIADITIDEQTNN